MEVTKEGLEEDNTQSASVFLFLLKLFKSPDHFCLQSNCPRIVERILVTLSQSIAQAHSRIV